MTQLLLNIAPDWHPTLTNFVEGRNSELLEALHLALTSSDNERIFYLWGEAGSGKTHLLQAVARAAGEMQRSTVYAQGSVPCIAEAVAIDDVECFDDNAQIALFNLYNQIRESGAMLLISGTQAPHHLSLRDDLRSRLAWGLVYQVHGLNDAEKEQALVQHAQTKGFVLPPEVVQYLLRHGRRDLPSLMAVLDALDAHTLRLHRAPSVPLLREVMQATSQ